jgi:hypothetical protein
MDALNAPAPLLYTERAATSAWLKALPPHVVSNLQNQALAMENHAHGERGRAGGGGAGVLQVGFESSWETVC